jgi:hypothetical protein
MIDSFCKCQIQQSAPFSLWHAREFFHNGIGERICAPQEVNILPGPAPMRGLGALRRGIRRRKAMVYIHHYYWKILWS